LYWNLFDSSCDLNIESTDGWDRCGWERCGRWMGVLLQSRAKAQCQGSSPTGTTNKIAAVEKRVRVLFCDSLCNLPLIIRITNILISKTRLRHVCNYPEASPHCPPYSSNCVSILQSQLDKSILPAFRISVSVSTKSLSCPTYPISLADANRLSVYQPQSTSLDSTCGSSPKIHTESLSWYSKTYGGGGGNR